MISAGRQFQQVQSVAVGFKECIYALEGEDKCPHSLHVGPCVKRMNPPVVAFILAVPAGFNDKGKVSHMHLPLGPDGFAMVLTYRFERRVWKFLLQHFPGPMVFVSGLNPTMVDALVPPP